MPHSTLWTPLRAASWLLAPLALLALSGCNGENPACVFGPTNCQGGIGGGSTGALGNAAVPPSGGEFLVDGAPSLVGLFPTTAAATTTPIAISFSESLDPASLDGAFVIQSSVDVTGFGGIPVIASVNLLAEGRLVVLLPIAPLDPNTTYEVSLSEDAAITDLTGQAFAGPTNGFLGTFSTAPSDPTNPALVTSFPRNAALGASTNSSVVVVFDAPVDESSVTDASFDVKVGGADPSFDPLPQAITAGGFLPVSDTRVFVYQSVDDSGQPVSLGTSSDVVVTLSAVGSEITAGAGSLPTTTIEYTTAALEPPLGGTILSSPSDAIGLANLSPGADAFQLEVQFSDAAPDDVLGVFLFGVPQDDPGGNTVAVLRELVLTGTAPITSVVLSLDELQLTQESDPTLPIFADGPIAFGLRLERGATVTSVGVLDADPNTPLIQDPLLDTTAPELVALSHPGGVLSFRSDLRDLSIGGTANEQLSAVEVVTSLGDNLIDVDGAMQAPVVGSDSTGLFLARPVSLGASGVLEESDLPLDYSLVLVDRAGNRSVEAIAGTYVQLGQVGPGAIVPDGSISVRVYDADTLEPVPQAAVMTHAIDTGFPLVANSATTTDEQGVALTLAAGASTGGTILSVSADGYDNFSFHGLAANRISVPLQASSPASTLLTGIVSSTDAVASGLLPLVDTELGDTRRPDGLVPTFATAACTVNPFTGELAIECPFGPQPVRPGRLGAGSVLVGEYGVAELLFAAPIAVQGFQLCVPVAGVANGETADELVNLVGLLSSPGVPEENAPVELTPLLVDGVLTFGIDFDDLVDDVRFTGEPTVSVEALIPGLTGAVPIARGNGFPQGTTDPIWLARSAAPGEAVGLGSLAQSGVFDTDLMIRVELVDGAGNVSGQRTRQSRVSYFGSTVFPASIPRLLAPTPGASTGGPSFDIEFDDSFLDVQGDPATQAGVVGVYRVRVTDSAGRGWTLWRADEPGGNTAATLGSGPSLSVHVPNVAAGGGSALASGELSIAIDTFSWPTFQPADFLFSDVEREYEAFSRGAPQSVTQP